jgi:hypothetical protein
VSSALTVDTSADAMDFANAANIIHTGFWWEIQEERDHWENLDINGRMLDWILEEEDGVALVKRKAILITGRVGP